MPYQHLQTVRCPDNGMPHRSLFPHHTASDIRCSTNNEIALHLRLPCVKMTDLT